MSQPHQGGTVPPTGHLADAELLGLALAELGMPGDPLQGTIGSEDSARRHLLGCPDCADRMAEWRAVAWSVALASPEPEPGVVAEIWREAQRRTQPQPETEVPFAAGRPARGLRSTFRRLAATLRPVPLQPALAVRGPAVAAPRLLIFETEEHTISLSISLSPAPGGARIIGGIAPKAGCTLASGGRVALYAGGQALTGEISSYGAFTLDGVPIGDLHLEINLGGDVIEISPISIGGHPDPSGEE